jgi:hypothetical protein
VLLAAVGFLTRADGKDRSRGIDGVTADYGDKIEDEP